MKHISLNVAKEIKNILPDTLEKDLMDNEEICPVCHGLGVVLDSNIYGIKGDTSEVTKKALFPYNHQAIKFCLNCYNGVIKICEYCGKPLSKGTMKCNCEKQKEIDEAKEKQKYQEIIAKAKEVDIKTVSTYLYDKETDSYFADIEEFIDKYKNNKEMSKNLPEILWLCSEEKIIINANSIVEEACEELHEDAFYNISYEDKKELQTFLDNWCRKQSGTTTYYPSYNEYVKVQKKWFNK